MSNSRFPQGPVLDDAGYVSLEWQQWLQNPEFVTVSIDTPLDVASGGTGTASSLTAALTMDGPIYPATPLGVAQKAIAIYGGNGAPDITGGVNGDVYFRSDGAALTTIYQKRAGLWTGIV